MTLDLLADSDLIGDICFGEAERIFETTNPMLLECRKRRREAEGETVELSHGLGSGPLLRECQRRTRVANGELDDDVAKRAEAMFGEKYVAKMIDVAKARLGGGGILAECKRRAEAAKAQRLPNPVLEMQMNT